MDEQRETEEVDALAYRDRHSGMPKLIWSILNVVLGFPACGLSCVVITIPVGFHPSVRNPCLRCI